MNKSILTIFVVCLTYFAQSQLISTVRKSFYSFDKNILKNASILRDFYLDDSPDSIYNIGSYLIRKGFQNENQAQINYGKLIISSYYYEHGKAEVSIENLRACIQYYERRKDIENLADAQNMMGLALMYQEKNKEAISWFLKSLNNAQKLPEDAESYMAQINMVEAFYRLNLFESAEKELESFIDKVTRQKLNKGLRKAYQLKSKICFATERISEGIAYSKKSLQLAFQNGDKLGLSFAQNDMAIAYFQEGNELEAKKSFEKSLQLRKEIGNFPIICESYFNLGEYYYFKEDYSKAIQYYDSSFQLALKNKLLQEQVDALERIGECYSKSNSPQKAYEFMAKFAETQRELIQKIKADNVEIDTDLRNFRDSEQELNQARRERELQKRIVKSERNTFWMLILTVIVISLSILFLLKSRKNGAE
ncbi:MAG: tetratricopeptide repeat protein [Flavobacteriia bacterium]|jgi:tetratricopeptide (TPR) repeat protein